eukprot:TRINITY_DN687_c1_g1_i1.p1 TRINITY_DN687_c1_g1~~TRINITY_DN687_c1_g1_i1.p1  ORF type:complete len:293 (-),score=-11.91 TRINITY_DN687_c1_g1_i1:1138-1896(-)
MTNRQLHKYLPASDTTYKNARSSIGFKTRQRSSLPYKRVLNNNRTIVNLTEKKRVHRFYRLSEFCTYQTHYVIGTNGGTEVIEHGTVCCSLKLLYKLYLQKSGRTKEDISYPLFCSWRPENVKRGKMEICCCPRCKNGFETFCHILKQRTLFNVARNPDAFWEELQTIMIVSRNHILHEIKHYIKVPSVRHNLYWPLYFAEQPKVTEKAFFDFLFSFGSVFTREHFRYHSVLEVRNIFDSSFFKRVPRLLGL